MQLTFNPLADDPSAWCGCETWSKHETTALGAIKLRGGLMLMYWETKQVSLWLRILISTSIAQCLVAGFEQFRPPIVVFYSRLRVNLHSNNTVRLYAPFALPSDVLHHDTQPLFRSTLTRPGDNI